MRLIEVILKIKCDNDVQHLPQSVMCNNNYIYWMLSIIIVRITDNVCKVPDM